MEGRIGSLSICALMILSAFVVCVSVAGNVAAHQVNRPPISIVGDADLTAENGVVRGTGTTVDPFVIEGWEILPDTGIGISITSTRAHVLVRNVHISSDAWDSRGIAAYDVRNLTIEDTIVRVSGYNPGGLHGPQVVQALYSSNIRIFNCTVNGVYGPPVYFLQSSNFTIEQCYLYSSYACSRVIECDDFRIIGNTIVGTSYSDLLGIATGFNGLLYDNDFWTDNVGSHTIFLTDSHGLQFYHNNMYEVPGAQIYGCYNLSWSAGYPAGGNYWSAYSGDDKKSGPDQSSPGSDGIGDTPFQLGSVADPYPLMEPYLGQKHPGDFIELYVMGSAIIPIWDPLELIALPVDMYGMDRTVPSLTWSANRTDCSIVDNPSSPWISVYFRGQDTGLYEVSVTDGNVTSYVVIFVALGLQAILVSPSATSVPFGGTAQFTAIGYNAFGQVNVTPAWSTSDGSPIDQTGSFMATKYSSWLIVNATNIWPYTMKVYAKQEGVTGEATVQVMLNGTSHMDSDTTPDWWELKYSYDPFNSSDSSLDTDNDGLDALAEYQNGTIPTTAHSDGDGIPDGWEVNNGLNPLSGADGSMDPDSDGLSNYYEYVAQTDPQNPDTDSDGMPDGYEYMNALDPKNPSDAAEDKDSDGVSNLLEYQLGTNPRVVDSDGDGMPDGYELDHGLDPLNAADGNADLDGDGLPNAPEYTLGTDIENPDTDADGMYDGYEVLTGLDPNDPSDAPEDKDGDGLTNLEEFLLGIRADRVDTDGDGMPDGWEAANLLAPWDPADQSKDPDDDGLTNYWEYNWGADPNNPDSDSDGIPDGTEVEFGMNPTNATDAAEDWDEDGLDNLAEYANGTDVGNPDTDGDQLGDAFELMFTGTNPAKWDTDGNGIGDAIEFMLVNGWTGAIWSLPGSWIGMTISWANYSIQVKTNSTVLQGGFDRENRKLTISVGGPEGTRGAVDLVVPISLCNATDIALMLDGGVLEFDLSQNETCYLIHAEYTHSSHTLTAQFMTPGPSDGGKTGALYLVALAAVVVVAALAVILLYFRKGRLGRSGKPE